MPVLSDYNLRPLMEEDLLTILDWRNSERVRSNMYSDHLITVEEHRNWFASLDTEKTRYMVLDYEGRSAGLSYLTRIDCANASCEWGFYLGSDKLPRGTGTIMGYLALQDAFDELGLRKVCGEVLEFNRASCKFFDRLGFLRDGQLRQHVLKAGQYVDVILFSILANEWEDSHSARVCSMIEGETVEIG